MFHRTWHSDDSILRCLAGWQDYCGMQIRFRCSALCRILNAGGMAAVCCELLRIAISIRFASSSACSCICLPNRICVCNCICGASIHRLSGRVPLDYLYVCVCVCVPVCVSACVSCTCLITTWRKTKTALLVCKIWMAIKGLSSLVWKFWKFKPHSIIVFWDIL